MKLVSTNEIIRGYYDINETKYIDVDNAESYFFSPFISHFSYKPVQLSDELHRGGSTSHYQNATEHATLYGKRSSPEDRNNLTEKYNSLYGARDRKLKESTQTYDMTDKLEKAGYKGMEVSITNLRADKVATVVPNYHKFLDISNAPKQRTNIHYLTNPAHYNSNLKRIIEEKQNLMNLYMPDSEEYYTVAYSYAEDLEKFANTCFPIDRKVQDIIPNAWSGAGAISTFSQKLDLKQFTVAGDMDEIAIENLASLVAPVRNNTSANGSKVGNSTSLYSRKQHLRNLSEYGQANSMYPPLTESVLIQGDGDVVTKDGATVSSSVNIANLQVRFISGQLRVKTSDWNDLLEAFKKVKKASALNKLELDLKQEIKEETKVEPKATRKRKVAE
jgi:hypothetical protein